MNIAKEDYKFLNPGGAADANFSPERNKKIIDGTIKKYNAMRRKKAQEYHAKLAERGEAAAYYLKHVDQGKSTKIENYFGKKELQYLRAQKIMAKVIDRKNKLVQFRENS